MVRFSVGLGSCLLLFAGTLAVLPAREPTVPLKPKEKTAQATGDPYALAARIDALIAKHWEDQKVVPAPLTARVLAASHVLSLHPYR